MKKNKRQIRRKITRGLTTALIVAIFLTPTILTTRWATGLVGSDDPRHVSEIEPLQVRPVDKSRAPLQPFSESLVSVTFDDGWESVYTKALPVLQQNGIRTTQYIISDTTPNYNYLSVSQIKSLKVAGHEIGSHTVDHADLTTLDDEELRDELARSKQFLSENFGPVDDFTSPYGAYNAHTLDMIGEYYRSQKNAEGDPNSDGTEAINTKEEFSPLNIVSYTVRKSTTTKQLESLLNEAKNNNGWLVLTYHQIDYSNDIYAVTPEVFAKQMKLVSSQKMRIPAVGDVLDILAPRQKVVEF